MKRRLIIALAALIALPIVLVLVAIVVIVSLGDAQHQWLASRVLSKALDSPVAFRGPFSLDVSLEPTLVARDVRIGSGDVDAPSDEPIDGQLGEVDLELDLRNIFSGVLVIRELEVRSVDLSFAPAPSTETDGDNDPWTGWASPLQNELGLFIDTAVLEDVRIERRGAADVPPLVVELSQLSFDEVDASGTFFVLGDGQINGSPLQIQGDVGFLSAYWDMEKPAPVDVSITHAAFDAILKGEVAYADTGVAFDLTADANILDLQQLGRILGETDWLPGRVAAFGRLSGDPARARLSEISVGYDDDDGRALQMTGEIALADGVGRGDLEFVGHLPRAHDLVQPHVDAPLPALTAVALDASLHLDDSVWSWTIGQVLIDGVDNWSLAGSGRAILVNADGQLVTEDMSIDLVLIGAETATVARLAGQSLPPLGPVRAEAELVGNRDGLQLEDLVLDVGRSDDLKIAGQGRVDLPWISKTVDSRPPEMALNVVLRGAEAARIAGLAGRGFPEMGPVSADAVLLADGAGLRIEDLVLDVGRDDTLLVTARGSLDLPEPGDSETTPRADLTVTVGAAQVESVTRMFEIDLPMQAQGRLDLRTALRGGGGEAFRLDDLTAGLGSAPSLLYGAAGTVGGVAVREGMIRASDIDMVVTIEGPVADLAQSLDLPARDPGQIRVVARASGDDRQLRFDIQAFESSFESGFVSRLGDIADGAGFILKLGDEIAVEDLKIPVDIAGPDVSALNVWMRDRVIPNLGALAGTQVVVLKNNKLGLQNIAYTIGPPERPSLTLNGGIDDALGLEKVFLAADFSADLATMIDVFEPAHMEALGRVEGRIEISDADGTLGIETFEMASVDASDLRLNISGVLDNLRELAEADLSIEVFVPHLWIIQSLVRSDIEPDKTNIFYQKSVGITGRFVADDAAGAASFEGVGRLGEGQMDIDLAMRDLTTRPDIVGTLDLSKLDLREFGVELFRREPGQNPSQTDWLFPESELYILPLPGASLDLAITIPEVSDPVMTLRRIEARMLWSEDIFALSPARFTVAGGEGMVDLKVDFDAAEVKRNLSVRGVGMDLGNILSRLTDGPPDADGLITVDAMLETRGNTPRALASTVNGRVGFSLVDGTVARANLNMLSSDTLQWMSAAFGKSETVLDCVIASFDIDDGVADSETLLVVTNQVALRGDGKLDFKNERVDVIFEAERPDKAPPSLARPFGIKGPMAAPEVDFSVKGHLADIALLPVYVPWRMADFLVSGLVGGKKEIKASPCISALDEHHGGYR